VKPQRKTWGKEGGVFRRRSRLLLRKKEKKGGTDEEEEKRSFQGRGGNCSVSVGRGPTGGGENGVKGNPGLQLKGGFAWGGRKSLGRVTTERGGGSIKEGSIIEKGKSLLEGTNKKKRGEKNIHGGSRGGDHECKGEEKRKRKREDRGGKIF